MNREMGIRYILMLLAAAAGLFLGALLAPAQEVQIGPPCLYEVLISGDSVKIGWTTPPCDANLDPLNPRQHVYIYHSSTKMAACGALAIYRLPQYRVPSVDTTFNKTGSLCPPLGPRVTEDGR